MPSEENEADIFLLKRGPDPFVRQMLVDLLARLDSGEHITSLALLIVTTDGWEYPSSGSRMELIAAADRFIHRMHLLLDEG